MDRYFFAIFTLLLSACASTGAEIRAECESKFIRFSDIYRCTYDAVATENPAILQDERTKLYLFKGKQLVKEVQKGNMSSADAKASWQDTLIELQHAKDTDISGAVNSLHKDSPPVKCLSYQLGNSFATSCR